MPTRGRNTAGTRARVREHVRKLGRRLASSGTCRARLILNTCFLVLAGPVPMRGEWSLCSIMPYRNVQRLPRTSTVMVSRSVSLYAFYNGQNFLTVYKFSLHITARERQRDKQTDKHLSWNITARYWSGDYWFHKIQNNRGGSTLSAGLAPKWKRVSGPFSGEIIGERVRLLKFERGYLWKFLY